MALNFRRFFEGLGIVAKTTSTVSVKGEMDVTSADGKVNYHNGTTSSPMVTESHTATLSNKTLDNSTVETIKDANFTIQDDGDTTKQLKFQASGISTGTTRTLTAPDASTTIVGTDATQTLSNKTLDNTNTINIKDTLFTIQDDGDSSKLLKFQASGITTATTRTLTAPDANTTITGTDATQTLSNKTFGDAITGTQIATPANPASGFNKLYFKSDNLLYTLTSAGTEASLSGSFDSSRTYNNGSIAGTVAANALTVALKDKAGSNPTAGSPVQIAFRNSTAGTGTYTLRSVTAALSVVVSSGSTLGHSSAVEYDIYVYALDNAGTVELAVSSHGFWDEGSLQTTTAEGGAGAADSNSKLYSTTARSNVPIRLIARLKSNQTTAGTWASSPTEISNIPFDIKNISAAYTLTSAQTVATATTTILNYNNKVIDTHNAVTTGASWKFTAPTAGKYQISGVTYLTSVNWTLGKRLINELFKNGSLSVFQSIVFTWATNTNDLSANGNYVLSLAADDFIDIRANHNSGSTENLDTSGVGNYITIERIGN